MAPGNQKSHDRKRYVTLTGLGRDTNMFMLGLLS